MRVFLAVFLSSIASAQQPWPLIQIPGYNVFCAKPRLNPAGDSTVCTVSTPFTAPNLSGIFYEPVLPLQFDGTQATTALQNKINAACKPGGLISTDAGGTWSGVVGSDGYEVEADNTQLPAYATVAITSAGTYTWAASTTDVRALQKPSATTSRIAATWYAPDNFTIDIQINDAATHSLSVYAIDWDCIGRVQQYDLTNPDGTVATNQLTAFCNGFWQTWQVSGHTILKVTNQNTAANAVVSGLFFDPGLSNLPTPSGQTCQQAWADVCSSPQTVPQNCALTCDVGVGLGSLSCGPPLIQDANGIWAIKGASTTQQ